MLPWSPSPRGCRTISTSTTSAPPFSAGCSSACSAGSPKCCCRCDGSTDAVSRRRRSPALRPRAARRMRALSTGTTPCPRSGASIGPSCHRRRCDEHHHHLRLHPSEMRVLRLDHLVGGVPLQREIAWSTELLTRHGLHEVGLRLLHCGSNLRAAWPSALIRSCSTLRRRRAWTVP